MSLAITIVAVLGWSALDLATGIIMGLTMAIAWYAAEVFARRVGDHADAMGEGDVTVG